VRADLMGARRAGDAANETELVHLAGGLRQVLGMRMPGTLPSTARKSPRISNGASGLGSQVSRWLGPPASQMSTAESAVPLV